MICDGEVVPRRVQINAVLQTGLSGFPRHVVTVLAALYGYYTSLICPRKHGVHMNC